MDATANALDEIIAELEPRLHQISAHEAAQKAAPGKWSKKEILGHLIDSAANNQQKFVRTMLAEKPLDFVGYEQDSWVAIQQYQQQSWADIIALWASYNRHLAHLIRGVDERTLAHTISISGSGPYTLAFLMSDYVEHLKHHLIQIIPDAGLHSEFSMTPYV